MTMESVTAAEARQGSWAGRLPIFDHIASGFLKRMASQKETSELVDYLDGADRIDGASYMRRAVVLAVEDLKQQIEAPPSLQSEAYARMRLLKLDPVPELKLYRDIATAILRIDAALHLTSLGYCRTPRNS
ncbi:MAG: hypothetical protein ACLPWS_19550 [Rhodomicrobium sp.]